MEPTAEHETTIHHISYRNPTWMISSFLVVQRHCTRGMLKARSPNRSGLLFNKKKGTPTYYYIITKSPLNHPSHSNLLTSSGILHGIVQIMKLENLLAPRMITAAGYRPALG